eukprot:8744214-Pyramimonas_sp.AAC.1
MRVVPLVSPPAHQYVRGPELDFLPPAQRGSKGSNFTQHGLTGGLRVAIAHHQQLVLLKDHVLPPGVQHHLLVVHPAPPPDDAHEHVVGRAVEGLAEGDVGAVDAVKVPEVAHAQHLHVCTLRAQHPPEGVPEAGLHGARHYEGVKALGDIQRGHRHPPGLPIRPVGQMDVLRRLRQLSHHVGVVVRPARPVSLCEHELKQQQHLQSIAVDDLSTAILRLAIATGATPSPVSGLFLLFDLATCHVVHIEHDYHPVSLVDVDHVVGLHASLLSCAGDDVAADQ